MFTFIIIKIYKIMALISKSFYIFASVKTDKQFCQLRYFSCLNEPLNFQRQY